MNEWRPIETAPLNKPILVYWMCLDETAPHQFGVATGRRILLKDAHKDNLHELVIDWRTEYGQSAVAHFAPDCWMPLPLPPGENESAA
jgi:hypothetical protein